MSVRELIEEGLTDPELSPALLAFLQELATPPKLGLHAHKCGFDRDPTRTGCGHEWVHDGRESQAAGQRVYDATHDVEAANRAYDDMHACPKCGRGPWKLQVTPEMLTKYGH